MTSSGYTIDQAIQVGVDNPTHPFVPITVGLIAGDEESYTVFAELFDPIIEVTQNGYKPTGKQKHDLDAAKLRGRNSVLKLY